jgi:hypothetical protein
MAIIKLSNGEEKASQADTADSRGPMFVLFKWNKKRRKIETVDTIPAVEVICAHFPDGSIVFGRGARKST